MVSSRGGRTNCQLAVWIVVIGRETGYLVMGNGGIWELW